MALDELEALGRVEVLHDHDGRPEAEHRHAVDERSRVIQRRGREVHRIGSGAAPCQCQRDLDGRGGGVAHGGARELFAHTLGPARGPRRVEHLAPLGLVGDGPSRERRHGAGVVVEPGEPAPDRQPHRDTGQVELRDHVGHGRSGHERGGAAVVEDVLHLGAAQVTVERRVVETRALGRPRHLEEGGAVLHEDGDVVAGTEAFVAQQPRQAVGAFVELPVRKHLAAPHDDSGGIRVLPGARRQVQRECGSGAGLMVGRTLGVQSALLLGHGEILADPVASSCTVNGEEGPWVNWCRCRRSTRVSSRS